MCRSSAWLAGLADGCLRDDLRHDLEQGNCRMTFEAPPASFNSVKTTRKHNSPHRNLSKTMFLTKSKEGWVMALIPPLITSTPAVLTMSMTPASGKNKKTTITTTTNNNNNNNNNNGKAIINNDNVSNVMSMTPALGPRLSQVSRSQAPVLRPITLLRSSLLRSLDSNFPGNSMGLGIPPLKIKILLESNPLKSRVSVRRSAVYLRRALGPWPAGPDPSATSRAIRSTRSWRAQSARKESSVCFRLGGG